MDKLPDSSALARVTTTTSNTPTTSTSQTTPAPQVRAVSDTRSSFNDSGASDGAVIHAGLSRQQMMETLRAGTPDELFKIVRQAASNGDVALLKLMVECMFLTPGGEQLRANLHAAVNARDVNGNTLLIHLLKCPPDGLAQRAEFKLILLRVSLLGADVKMQDSDGNNAAMLAIRRGFPARDVASFLDPAVIDHANHDGETALMAAVTRQDESLVELLLEQGASPTLQTPARNESALQLALSDADYVNDSIREMLRKAAPQQLQADGTAMVAAASTPEQQAFQAIRTGDRKSLERLLIKNAALANVRTQAGHTLLMLAAIHGRLDIARLLLDRGARMNEKTASKDTALLYAIRHGHAHLANWLIDKGASFSRCNQNRQEPLSHATAKGMASVVANLLRHGASTETAQNKLLLDIAFSSNSPETLQAVLGHLDASADGREHLNAALYLECYGCILDRDDKRLARLEMLMDSGADVDTLLPDSRSNTTLLMFVAGEAGAKFPNCIAVASLLIRRGATLEPRDEQGRTALDIARQGGHQPMIDLLSGMASSSSSSSFRS